MIVKGFFYSQTGGMAVGRPYGFEIDFVRNPITGSAAWFFVIILKFIFTAIFKIKIHEKNPWHQKISFSKHFFIEFQKKKHNYENIFTEDYIFLFWLTLTLADDPCENHRP